MTFGHAIQALKAGHKVARKGMERQRDVPLAQTGCHSKSRMV